MGGRRGRRKKMPEPSTSGRQSTMKDFYKIKTVASEAGPSTSVASASVPDDDDDDVTIIEIYDCHLCPFSSYDPVSILEHHKAEHGLDKVEIDPVASPIKKPVHEDYVNDVPKFIINYDCNLCLFSSHDQIVLSDHHEAEHGQDKVESDDIDDEESRSFDPELDDDDYLTFVEIFDCNLCTFSTNNSAEHAHDNVESDPGAFPIKETVNEDYEDVLNFTISYDCKFCSFSSYDPMVLSEHHQTEHAHDNVEVNPGASTSNEPVNEDYDEFPIFDNESFDCHLCEFSSHNPMVLLEHHQAEHSNEIQMDPQTDEDELMILEEVLRSSLTNDEPMEQGDSDVPIKPAVCSSPVAGSSRQFQMYRDPKPDFYSSQATDDVIETGKKEHLDMIEEYYDTYGLSDSHAEFVGSFENSPDYLDFLTTIDFDASDITIDVMSEEECESVGDEIGAVVGEPEQNSDSRGHIFTEPGLHTYKFYMNVSHKSGKKVEKKLAVRTGNTWPYSGPDAYFVIELDLPTTRVRVQSMDRAKLLADGKPIFECPFCPYVTDKKLSESRHFGSYHSNRRQSCNLCDGVFKTAHERQLHMILMHKKKFGQKVKQLDDIKEKKSKYPSTKSSNHTNQYKIARRTGNIWPYSGPDAYFVIVLELPTKKAIVKSMNKENLLANGKTIFQCIFCPFVTDNNNKDNYHFTKYHSTMTKWICEDCPEPVEFKTLCERDFHKNNVHEEFKKKKENLKTKFKCSEPNCDYIGKSQPEMSTHHQNTHAAVKDNGICSYCGEIFKTNGALKEHTSIHLECPSDKICPFPGCGLKIKDVKDWQKTHIKTHKKFFRLIKDGIEVTSTEEYEKKCPDCYKVFRFQIPLRLHIRSYHKPPPNEGKCLHCDEIFLTTQDLNRHFSRSHADVYTKTFHKIQINKTDKECDVCHRFYKDEIGLQEHEERLHRPFSTPLECCGLEIKDEIQLTSHRKNVHGLAANGFVCSICGLEFANRNGIKEHKATHGSGNGTYACALCPELPSFDNKSLFRDHYIEVHKFNYTCKFCPFTTTKESEREKHSIKHKAVPKYPCTKCHFIGLSEEALISHDDVYHTNVVQPFSCEACKRGFANDSDLKRHELFHLVKPRNPHGNKIIPFLDTEISYGTVKCGDPGCIVDNYIIHRSFVEADGVIWPIQSRYTDKDGPCIYGISCDMCEGALYVGQTGRTGRVRFKEHLYSLAKGDKRNLYRHFRENGHSHRNIMFEILSLAPEDTTERVLLESAIIEILRTFKTEKGLNMTIGRLPEEEIRF